MCLCNCAHAYSRFFQDRETRVDFNQDDDDERRIEAWGQQGKLCGVKYLKGYKSGAVWKKPFRLFKIPKPRE
jgi:hypothetical protein